MVTTTNHFMFASSTPLLKGQQICDFLTKMDELELQILEKESKKHDEIIASFLKEYNFQSKASIAAVGIGTLAASVSAALLLILEQEKAIWVFFSGLILGVCGGVGLDQIKNDHIALSKKEITNIHSERILRLQDKIREIEKRMKENLQESEKTQLPRAKDYFEWKKVELVTIQTNFIELKVRRV